MNSVELRPVEWPDFTTSPERPSIPAEEYVRRCEQAYAKAGRDWLVVYGDREHWGNIGYLSGFDPRFEETLLLLGPEDSRILVVGNEGMLYRTIAGLDMDVALCQTLSLMDQPRSKAPRLADVLREAGMTTAQSTAVAGWKYLSENEVDDPTRPAFIPAFVVDSIARVTGVAPVDGTGILMNPVDGLRTTVDAEQIASWEYSAVHAAKAVFDIIAGTQPGMSEYDSVARMNYQGDPLSVHVMFASGKATLNGLRSPSAKAIEQGDAVTTAVGFRGGLTCRAGVLADNADDFLAKTAFPYFRAIRAWYTAIGVDITGGDVWANVMHELDTAEFGPLVNPGHLIGHEEWTNSPFEENSTVALRSGMAMQCDIIPSPLPPGHAINAEDTVVLADAELRDALATTYPDLWRRIQQRRSYMRDQLGIVVGEDVLPLSPTCGYLTPLWQAPTHSCITA